MWLLWPLAETERKMGRTMATQFPSPDGRVPRVQVPSSRTSRVTRFVKTLDRAWKGVLLNQFHDILPGSSIGRVYEEAEALYAEVIAEAERTAKAAAGSLVKGARAPTIFNDLSWERKGLVALPAGLPGPRMLSGSAVPVQAIGDRVYAEVRVPSCGWTTLWSGKAGSSENEFLATPRLLENSLLRVTFNDRGEIISLVDKTAPLGELAAGPGNRFEMFKDVPSRFDAWDIDSMAEQTPVTLDGPATIEAVSEGLPVAALRISRTLHNSTMVQEGAWRRGVDV